MGELNILVWNCGGLNAPHKRASTLGLFKKRNVDIALLQETHLLKADTVRLADKFYHTIAFSSADSKTKGVSIVARRNLRIKVLSSWADDMGRIVITGIEFNSRKIALVSAYAPNVFDSDFYNVITVKMLELTDYSFIVGADFNAVWDPVLDRSSASVSGEQGLATKALKAWAINLGLTDIWRLVNPSAKDYTFFSGRHKSFSRIDFLFASPQLFHSVNAAVLLPMALSDHKGVFCSVNLGRLSKRAARWRFNTSLLKNEAFVNQFVSGFKEFIGFNAGSVEDPRVLWDAIKGFIRSNTILFSSNARKSRSLQLQNLEAEFSRLDSILQLNFTEQVALHRALVKKEINNVMKLQSEFQIHRTRQRYYFHGARPSHLLAMRIRSSDNFADIPAIKSANGNISTDPKQINGIFQAFYSTLYESEVPADTVRCDRFLNQLHLPKLPNADSANLERPITLEELRDATRTMQNGRSPGIDGIPPEFYVTFWEQLGPFLLDMVNFSVEKGRFARDVNTALISLLLKKDKDPTDCSSYRPLSLLNADLKIFAKLLARRLESLMPLLVSSDQTGFIKSRLAADNVRRLLHVIDGSTDNNIPISVLSLDALKAFDRLEWSYLWSVLEVMGFGTAFIGMIKTLYSNPSAQVLTGQTFSALFPVSRSSRQGCPLSPALFVLSLEPLAQAIRQSSLVSPVSVHNTPHQLSLYADDILVFLQNPAQSLPPLLSICEEFGNMSGFKVNWSKSALLHLNDSAKTSVLPANIPIVRQFKYLGIEIFPSLNQIIKYNYSHALNNVLRDMDRWNSLPISIRARVSIIKMNVLPRINFISSMVPLPPPSEYWTKLRSATTKFIWNRKRPRLKLSTLQRRREDGGMAVPNFELYSWSFVLRPLLAWFDPHSSVSWRVLELNIVDPWTLKDILFINMSKKQCQLRFGPIISHLVKVWRLAETHCHISCKWHTFSPIFNNKALLIGGRPISAPQWERKGVHYLGDIYNDQGLLSFSDIKDAFNLPGSSFFFYLQLRSALKAHGVPWQNPLPNHPLRELFIKHAKNKGMVSKIYHFLLVTDLVTLPIQKVWERDCPDITRDFKWVDVWSSINEASRNPDHQHIHFNFLHRTYLTPVKLHHMKVVTTPLCTLCSLQAQGTFIHMFWDCPPVGQFWSNVASKLSELLQLTVPVSICVLVLNDLSTFNLSKFNKRVVFAGLTAAKKMIATRWKPPHSLAIKAWILSFLDVIYLELSTARVNGANERTLNSWRTIAVSLKDML